MPTTSESLMRGARRWAERVAALSWLPAAEVQGLSELESRSPAALFEAGLHRPLVAAFFGGTGVGKSSLLNRLVGQPLARTGVERPTSREISLYLHESLQIAALPNDLPLEKVRIARHNHDSMRQVLWIDMPDIDSIEQRNRLLVLDWLPHIDCLIYVVNPERYRDDKGWRLLQSQGGQHAWVFVMNQWDRAHAAQLEDFAALLGKGGFEDPIILRTDCREDPAVRKPDDFPQLQEVLKALADRHVISQLEGRTESVRLRYLARLLEDQVRKLGDEAGYRGLQKSWTAIWERFATDLRNGLEWPINVVARAFVGREVNPLQRSVDLTRQAPAPAESPRSALWDGWAEDQLRDALDRLVVEAGENHLPVVPLKVELDEFLPRAGALVLASAQRHLRETLAHPGNAAQRVGLRIAGVLTVILPLAAIGWAAYRVVIGYYESAANHLGYLGTDFAIHTLLLIALTWLLPYFVYRRLKPSAETVAVKGLREGIRVGLEQIREEVGSILEQVELERQALREEALHLAHDASAAIIPENEAPPPLLRRVLPAATGPVPGDARVGSFLH